MGKVLKILGLVFLVLVVGIVGLFVWAHKSGAGKQEEFFEAVYSDNPANVMAMFHPAMSEEVDEPVLATWMRVFKERHGEFKGLSATNFSTNKEIQDGVGVLSTEGTVNFANGTARSKLVFRDGQITNWSVESEKMTQDWFEGPDDTTFYQQRAKTVLTHLLSNEPAKAFALFGPALRESSPMTRTADIAERAPKILGELESITFMDESFEVTDTGQYLTVRHAVTCKKTSAVGTVRFRFSKMKGLITQFSIDPE